MIILILTALVIGIIFGYIDIARIPYLDFLTTFTVAAMVFFIGIDIGSNKKVLQDLKKKGLKILLLPLGIAFGSILFSLFAVLFTKLNAFEVMSIGAGLGYYSLSSIIIANMSYPALGVVAFLSNIIREVLTIVLTPLLVKIDSLSPVASGGATAMDTTLGVIKKYTNDEVAFVSVISGVILTALIPFLVSFFAGFI